ncbi:MAG TPA: bifunctional precorrin-2 dehydrogenase/sirohydrochlorin ferrochelatase [Dehalococcoidia bacterium]|nr:bifunctional precorrin-2 dehydrogenase/sirohydrochlorin ferrochelatase [Dehalococcoidia bacterium]
MAYYPVFLELKGRPCLVVGGGQVAARKVEGLLAAGARVTVVSRSLDPDIAKLAAERRIQHVERPYQHMDLKGYAVVITATDDAQTNQRVAADARQGGVPVNVVDEPALCDFILPSVVRRGDVVLAISTGGLSPALARWLREELEAYLSEDFERLVQLLAEVRGELRERGASVTPEAWQRAIDKPLRELVVAGRHDEARTRLLSALGVAPELKT